MECQMAAGLLTRLGSATGAGARVSLSGREEMAFRDLVKAGYVAPVTVQRVDPAEMERLKAGLAALQRREAELRKLASISQRQHDPPESWRPALAEIERLSLQENAARSKVLDLAERGASLEGSVKVDGGRFAVTYRGRDLADRLGPRLARVGASELAEFETALIRLRTAFSARAGKAYAVLKALSPYMLNVDEIHLRSAAVGLAVREEPPSEVSTAYRRAFQWLRPEAMRPMIAENLCVASPALDERSVEAAVGTFTRLREAVAQPGVALSDDDAVRASLMLQPFGEWAQSVLQEAATFSDGTALGAPSERPDLSAAVMVVGSGSGGAMSRLGTFRAYQDALRAQGIGGSDLSFGAALLTVGGDPEVPAAVARTAAVREYLGRFAEDGMTVPASMLAILSPQVEESLDNLRLASAEISRNRLSLGGMENLSLGMKLLLQTAITPNPVRGIVSPRGVLVPAGPVLGPEPVQPPATVPAARPPTAPMPVPSMAMLGVALAAPIIILPALIAFHEKALHRLAVSDWAFHPVHTNFVYG